MLTTVVVGLAPRCAATGLAVVLDNWILDWLVTVKVTVTGWGELTALADTTGIVAV
jgi:hypothetical protein